MAYRDLILADGPSLYWPLDSTYGATDQSGNSRNGSASGGITIGGFADSPIADEATCTDFDGSNDAITSSYDPYVDGTTRTFSGWAYRDTSATQDNLIGSSAAGVLLRLETNQVVNFYADWSFGGANVGTWPGNTQWVHWALIYIQGTSAQLYLNGVPGSAVAYTRAWLSTASALYIGSLYPFDGKMAHVAVWERALTASEVQSHYRAGVDGSPANRKFIHQAGGIQ